MTQVTLVPEGLTIQGQAGALVYDLLHGLGVDALGRCGGVGACGTCVVGIRQGEEALSEPGEVEAAFKWLAPGERLACQCRLTGATPIVLEILK